MPPHLVNGNRNRSPVADVQRAALQATLDAGRAHAAVMETLRTMEETIQRSRLLREQMAEARDARAAGRNGGRPETVAALQTAAQRLLSLAEAAERRAARDDPAPAPDTEPLLTRRQREILALVAEGVGTEEIAARLWLSVATVRNHVARTLRALDAHSRVEAVAKARRLGLL